MEKQARGGGEERGFDSFGGENEVLCCCERAANKKEANIWFGLKLAGWRGGGGKPPPPPPSDVLRRQDSVGGAGRGRKKDDPRKASENVSERPKEKGRVSRERGSGRFGEGKGSGRGIFIHL